MIYDLHAHSNVSDGILDPKDVVLRARDRSVDVLALTDHDTLAGLQSAAEAAAGTGLTLIAGIEFSTQWLGRGIHVLGLNIDPTDAGLQDVVASQSRQRWQRARLIAGNLRRAGIKDPLDGARRFASADHIARPHFARYLVEAGYVSTVALAFRKYLGAGTVGDVPHGWLEMADIVQAIKLAGGVAVLAHPGKYNLTRSRICRLAEAFRDLGGQGLEVISGVQTSQVTADMGRIANQVGLYASCGSDFHMPDRSWQELGAAGALPANCRPVWQLWN